MGSTPQESQLDAVPDAMTAGWLSSTRQTADQQRDERLQSGGRGKSQVSEHGDTLISQREVCLGRACQQSTGPHPKPVSRDGRT